MKTRLLLLIILLGCTDNRVVYIQTMDFGSFTVNVPATWKKLTLDGIDSYVGQIILDHDDTVMFDLGWYSNSLEEEPKYYVDHGDVYVRNEKKSTPRFPYYEFYGDADTVDVERFHVNKTSFTTIDGRRAKIVQPKTSGTGMTGIYFDSLWIAGSGIDRFQMSGTNLHPESEQRLLRAFETLRFKK